ncbi:putative glycosyltransferase [Cafeteria roenbergensis virus]|uniref:Putative glycosyltransferase n=1 Tax=Cafeteria roenbergensis virus (strain BV-PW1) TaxID=693272 RepID=E3T517_CROVB|nr:putative glycosyltransferase [Cafeteria roenbergensis virus BV-PW1]ADO67280.1 putative glycosyltransferase [Cafeteria roenbergensis virus BV-PW1]
MFDLIIPCLYSHFKYIPTTLKSFHHQNLINRIIIIINGINNKPIDKTILKNYNKIDLILINEKIFPGIARNIGLKNAQSQYVVFHDADDQAHPDKLLILKNCFDKYQCDHILHLIQPIEINFLNYDLAKIKVIPVEKLRTYYYKNNKCDFGDIIGKRCSHGLSAVKKNKIIDIEWLNVKSGEDKDFNIKSLIKGNKIILVDAYLSKYDKYKMHIMKRYHPNAWNELNKNIN